MQYEYIREEELKNKISKDYLGSVQSLSEVNSQGNVVIVAEFSYDAWGRARAHTNWTYTYQSDASVPGFALLERGFTGHEHIIQFGIINMNARLYDPVIASFLSPDDVVSDPENPQNYNRFSYALNNPMRYTDPSGNNPFLAAAFLLLIDASIKNGIDGAMMSIIGSGFSYGMGNLVNGAFNGIFSNHSALTSFSISIAAAITTDAITGMMFEGKYTGAGALYSVLSSATGWLKNYLEYSSQSMNEVNDNLKNSGCKLKKELQPSDDPKITYTKDPNGSRDNSEHTFGDFEILNIVRYNEEDIQQHISINLAKKKKGENIIDYVKRESRGGGQMDAKLRLEKNTVYVLDNIGYNYAEMGNYIWGATIAKLNIDLISMNLGAQIYAFEKTGWFDQPWEVKAFNRAYFKYSKNFLPLTKIVR